jgi:RNA polymerase sigma-70 factor (ECF subfamily)
MSDFKQVIEEYYPILYKVGRLYSDNQSSFDDLYQEMLIQIYQSLNNFEGKSKLSTWIYRVALNTALTYRRNEKKKKREVPDETIGSFEMEDEAGEETRRREKQIELLYRSIRKLNPGDRGLIMLQLEGKQYDEIASIIGISKTNVGVKLMRVKKRLEKILREDGYEHV